MSHREGSASSTSGARREELEILSSTSSGARRTITASTPTIVPTSFITQSTGSATTTTGSPQSTSLAFSSNSTDNHVGASSSGNRKTIIVLATLMSIVGCLLIAGAIWTFIRCRRRRTKLFARGITPIGDDEIETWKGRRTEKGLLETDMDCPPPSSSSAQAQPQQKRHHQKTESATSLRKPPSVIVYARKSDEFSSPTSPTSASYPWAHKMSFDGVVVKRSMDGGGKTSFDKELPFTPIQARAPNAREGLTDEAIPGDEPFVGSPRRRGSRLSKQFSRYPQQTHARNKSSRSSSSLHRLGGYGYESDDFPPRPSHDLYRRHSRVSSSHQQEQQQPPRLSLSDDWPSGKTKLSAQQLPVIRAEDIGRAIG